MGHARKDEQKKLEKKLTENRHTGLKELNTPVLVPTQRPWALYIIKADPGLWADLPNTHEHGIIKAEHGIIKADTGLWADLPGTHEHGIIKANPGLWDDFLAPMSMVSSKLTLASELTYLAPMSMVSSKLTLASELTYLQCCGSGSGPFSRIRIR